MPRIGITGHTSLSARTTGTVYRFLTRELRAYPATAVHGITCLAAGADQLFVHAILAVGGTYEVILPAADYRDRVVAESGRAVFDELIATATTVSCMPFARSDRVAYMAASRELIRRSDLLLAVWDGSRSGRLGETGDVVVAARERRLPVTVLWPPDGARS